MYIPHTPFQDLGGLIFAVQLCARSAAAPWGVIGIDSPTTTYAVTCAPSPSTKKCNFGRREIVEASPTFREIATLRNDAICHLPHGNGYGNTWSSSTPEQMWFYDVTITATEINTSPPTGTASSTATSHASHSCATESATSFTGSTPTPGSSESSNAGIAQATALIPWAAP
ncbi:uncharacterized protein BDW43DRAFT_308701 [Aspergillus alliaceus]|uniref:uncharacterized protein n=1 Tax=Petromyces alliaceus TaxID=209559 RepID=UPI0012A55317|nr:uncharacterized protein BDW43DRAFT_308701 [Aspergillus alliaceus]KAB8235888.1 hypothetical protein BDW43DRAFT_308701 [Aspergillus alliaceus]